MKDQQAQYRPDETHDRLTCAKTLLEGITISAPNEIPVEPKINNLGSFMRILAPTRSSGFYDKIE